MILFLYHGFLNDGFAQTIVQINNGILSYTNIDTALAFDNGNAIKARIKSGKVSDFLDALDSLKADKEAIEFTKNIGDESLADLLVLAKISEFIEKGSIEFGDLIDRYYKISNELFYSMFHLVRIGKVDHSNDIYMNLYKEMLNISSDNGFSFLSAFNSSLTRLPQKIQKLCSNHPDILCMIQIRYDNLHSFEDVDKKALKDKAMLYLFTRPTLEFKEGKFDFANPKRKMKVSDVREWMLSTSGQKRNLKNKQTASFDQGIKNLETAGELIIDGDSLVITPLGLALSGFLIPRILKQTK